MTFSEFLDSAMHFAKYPKAHGLMYTTLGLCGEAGEVANKVKKIYRDDGGLVTDEKKAAISDELGDCLWYIAATAYELNLDLDKVAADAIFKLSDRLKRNVIQGSGDKR